MPFGMPNADGRFRGGCLIGRARGRGGGAPRGRWRSPVKGLNRPVGCVRLDTMAVHNRARELTGRLADAVRRKAPGILWHVGQRFGFAVVLRGPFSPVPDVPPADSPVWSRVASLPGVHLDLNAQLAFIESRLTGYVEEFTLDVRERGFDLWNKLYQAGDAEILYALLRHLKPQRVLEVGSGNSTLVSAAAVSANAREGARCELVAVDPHPRTELTESLEGLSRVERADCRELPLERYLDLQAGDVLFVDTTHVVKLGSEVNWLVLEVLPRLAAGVWVHFHDIFIPHQYPRYIFQTAGFLNEQYLLEALLLGGDWTIELAHAALFLDRHDAFVQLIPSLKEEVPGVAGLKTWLPSSLWIRRPSG